MVWSGMCLALVHVMRVKIIIFTIAVFCIQYAAYLYVLLNIRPINPNLMQVWRQIPFYIYVTVLWYMALDCSSQLERSMIKTGGLFIILVGLIILIDALDIYRNGPVLLMLASLLTSVFGLIVYKNSTTE